MNTTNLSPPRDNKKSRRSRGALAGLTILGLGMAMTTALFTDTVLFATAFEVNTFEVQGAATDVGGPMPTTWSTGTINIDLDDWRAGDANTVRVELWVRDGSGGPLTVIESDITVTGNTDGLTVTLEDEWVQPGTAFLYRNVLTIAGTAAVVDGHRDIVIKVTGEGPGAHITP